MTEVDWPTIRRLASEAFGELPPHPEVEDEIVAVFEKYPQVVLAAIGEVGVKMKAGRVRSGWRILRKELAETAEPRHTAIASFGDDREKRVVLAERWIRNTGLHLDRGEELVDELFGDRGRLRDWAGDELLVRRMVDVWEGQRPRGERVEREAVERGLAAQALRQRLEGKRVIEGRSDS